MMSTYELVIAFLSPNPPTSTSTTEVITVGTTKVPVDNADVEAIVVNESEY